MINALIIDDETLARDRLSELLAAYEHEINIIGEADCGNVAKDLIEKLKPDLLFLDIQMPDISGIDLLKQISYHPKIIFTTAYDHYALKAFGTYAIDYIIKPITTESIDKAINKLKAFGSSNLTLDLGTLSKLLENSRKEKENYYLTVKNGNKIILLDYEDISFFKAEEKYINIHLTNGKVHLTSKTLTDLDQHLPTNFIRIHRSYIINVKSISEIEKYFKGTLIVFLNDSVRTKLKSSEKYSKDLKQKLGLM